MLATGIQEAKIVSGLLYTPDGTCSSTGAEPKRAQDILQLKSSEYGGCTSGENLFLIELGQEDLPGLPSWGWCRLYVEAVFDDSCHIKQLPVNRVFPRLAGDVLLTCHLDVYKIDKDSIPVDEGLTNLPILEVFDQAGVDSLLRSYQRRTHNLEVKPKLPPVLAAYNDFARKRRWGNVDVSAAAPQPPQQHGSAEPPASGSDRKATAKAQLQQPSCNAAQPQKPKPKQKDTDFAANLRKAFGSS